MACGAFLKVACSIGRRSTKMKETQQKCKT